MRRQSSAIDDVLSVLDHPLRRHVLAVVGDREGDLSLDALVAALADRVHDSSVAALADETVTSIRVRLHHDHLPKLADSECIEYDRGADRVRAGSRSDVALCVLESVGSYR